MQGLMQDWPLRVSSIIDHAARYHGEREVVTRSLEGPIHRYAYADLRGRAKRFASALGPLDLRPGDRVGTLAWNTYRHVEAWYGLMGAGLVCHTLNPRLFREQLAYISGHAQDRCMLLDVAFVELAEYLQDTCPEIRGFVLLTDRAHMPATRLRDALCYEELVEAGDPGFEWVEVDESAAAGLCYTSGTTGNPKGVAYSHRSNVLHALAVNGGDALGLALHPQRAARRSAVPRQCLGAGIQRADGRRQARPARGPPGRREPVPADRGRACRFHRRRTHRVAGPAPVSRRVRAPPEQSRARGDRRLGRAAGDAGEVRTRLRGRSRPRLGDDRDEPRWGRWRRSSPTCSTSSRRRSCAPS